MTMRDSFAKYTDAETFARIVDYSCITEMWEHSVSTYAENVAIVDGRNYTYAELEEQVRTYRAVLAERGVQAGDKVGIYMPNSVQFVKAFLAITTMGAAAVLLPPHLDAMTLLGCSMKFGLKAVVYAESHKEQLALLSEKNPTVATISADETSDGILPAVTVDPSSLCAVLFTGGTTGRSKGARLSHRAVMAGTRNGCYCLDEVFEERYLLVLPLTHVFGLIRNLLTSLYTGSTLFICKNNKDMFRDIAGFRPTVLVLVPALAEMALNLSRQFGRNMLGPDLKYIICGAAAVAPYLVTEYLKYGVRLLPGYGLTESANLVSGNPDAAIKPDSVGFIYPGMDYKIVDGELWLKGENMMDGYVGDEENSIAYSPDGYFKTGDLVRMDDEGFLYITGRIKEIIVLSTGENVSPAELESYFYAVDEVQDCMVCSTVENGREILAVQIYPRMAMLKANGITDAEAYFKERTEEINRKLPAFEQISRVVVRETDFVRSPAMKIVRGKNGIDKS